MSRRSNFQSITIFKQIYLFIAVRHSDLIHTFKSYSNGLYSSTYNSQQKEWKPGASTFNIFTETNSSTHKNSITLITAVKLKNKLIIIVVYSDEIEFFVVVVAVTVGRNCVTLLQ